MQLRSIGHGTLHGTSTLSMKKKRMKQSVIMDAQQQSQHCKTMSTHKQQGFSGVCVQFCKKCLYIHHLFQNVLVCLLDMQVWPSLQTWVCPGKLGNYWATRVQFLSSFCQLHQDQKREPLCMEPQSNLRKI